MTSPTTPRDAIGLSERLREYNLDWLTRASSAQEVNEAIAAIDSLSARVKELEDDVRRLHGDKMDQFDRAIAAESRATRAEQERDEALERLKPLARDFEMNDCDDRADDDAMEVSIKDLRAARDCVRRLASGPDKEKRE